MVPFKLGRTTMRNDGVFRTRAFAFDLAYRRPEALRRSQIARLPRLDLVPQSLGLSVPSLPPLRRSLATSGTHLGPAFFKHRTAKSGAEKCLQQSLQHNATLCNAFTPLPPALLSVRVLASCATFPSSLPR